MNTFKALVLERNDEDQIVPIYRETKLNELSPGSVLIKVAYSSVNYKDALASVEGAGVVRSYPQIPGIDLSGTILASNDPRFKIGQEVLATGYKLGVSHSGGYSELAQVPAEWLVPLPDGLTLKEVMILGTAGFTAALAISALENNHLAENKAARILVTGASGGVGSSALGMLHTLGYTNLVALSRKKTETVDYFANLGVTTVLTPADITPDKISPLMKQQFDFVIDTVGGPQLEIILPQISYGGSLALCGNAGGIAFSATVLPHILRGVNLLGIDSVAQPHEKRVEIWQRLATDLRIANLENLISAEVPLSQLEPVFKALIDGQVTGRHLVTINQN